MDRGQVWRTKNRSQHSDLSKWVLISLVDVAGCDERHGQAVGQVTMTAPPEYHGPHAAGRQLGAEEVRVTDRLDQDVIVKETHRFHMREAEELWVKDPA